MDEKIDKKTPRNDTSLPPRSRPIAKLQPTTQANEDILSSNKVNVMKKTKYEMDELAPLYFFKNHDVSSRLTELESYGAAICEFLATSEYVSPSRPYYDENEQLIGVASKEIIGFQSNFEDPLQRDETYIHSTQLNKEENQRIIKDVAQKLLAYYEECDAASFTDPTIDDVQSSLFELLNQANPFPYEMLPQLTEALTARKNEVTNIDELALLAQGQDTIDTLLNLSNQVDEALITIELLEALDKEIKNSFIKNLDEYFKIPLKDITNYSLLKGLGVSLTTRYLFKEKDNNNANMSKKGQFIDFDWTKANISFELHAHNKLNELFRNAKDNSFPCDESTLENFPDIENANAFYWPTKQFEVQKVVFNIVGEFLVQCEKNLNGDEEIYKQIARCIWFVSKTKEHVFAMPTFLELTSNYAYQTLIYFKAFISRRTVEAVLAEETIKLTFAQLNEEVMKWTKEIDKEIANIDKKEVNEWIQKVLSTVDAKVTVLTTMYKEIKGVITTYSQDKLTEDEVNELNEFYGVMDELLEELKDRFDFFRSEIKKGWDCVYRNTFTLEDNRVYKSLAYNPVFIFHKYKTCLKYVLTNGEMYSAFASLNISQKPCIDKNGKSYNLAEKLVNDELQRIDEVRNTLVTMSDFKDFLSKHGRFAFELIQEEFQITSLKYKLKKEYAEPYQRLVKALDPDGVEQVFNALCLKCGIDNKDKIHCSIGEEDDIDYDLRLC